MKKLPTITKYCETCEKKMDVPPYWSARRFCSRSCLGKSNIIKINQVRKPAKSNPSWFTTEQVKGENNPRWVESIRFVCEHCDQEFFRKPWQTRSSGFAGKYCSTKCRNEHRRLFQSGENSPYWVGGILTYHGVNWPQIRLAIVKEQNYCCADCGVHVGESMPVHHKRPYRSFPTSEEANARDNLIGFCQSCHMSHETGNAGIPKVPKENFGFKCICLECKTEFIAMNPKANWCEDCRNKTCLNCKKQFRAILRNEVNKFCSRGCHYQYRRQN